MSEEYNPVETPTPVEEKKADESFEEVVVDKKEIHNNYIRNQKCLDDSSSESYGDSSPNFMSDGQNSFRLDESTELRITQQPIETPPEDDFMQRIINENNKNTYRWDFPQ